MGLYNNQKIQLVISIFYPIIIFGILSTRQNSWLIPITVTILFSLLWGNLRYLFLSTMLMWLLSVPMWWFIERTKEGYGAVNFIANLPLIIAEFIVFVLIPEMIVVTIRNTLINLWNKKMKDKN